MDESKTKIIDDFQRYFDIALATTPEHMAMVYRIRYRVYCEEFGYENADSFPDQLESDEFDGRSVHSLVLHKATGMPAACVRVVGVDSKTVMPMEKYCRSSISQDLFSSVATDRSKICEFSRLAVDGAFRRRAGEKSTRFGEITSLDCTRRELRTFSLIAVATFLSAFAVSDLIDRRNAFAMMEPFLPRLLKRSGILVKKVGEDIDYHGIRAPYFITTESAVQGMPDELTELYDTIHQKFSYEFPQKDDPIAVSASTVMENPWLRKPFPLLA